MRKDVLAISDFGGFLGKPGERAYEMKDEYLGRNEQSDGEADHDQ